MKNLFLTGFILLFSLAIMAQTPAMFNYQAVIRDSNSDILINEDINLTVEIVKTTESGVVVFSETHETSTNAYGVVNVKIGSVNSLAGIDFSDDSYFVRISVDDVFMGASQLLSVPYALHAKTADNMFSGNYADLINTPDLTGYLTDINGENLGDLSDVDLTNLSDNQILKYDAGLGKWISIDVAAASEIDPIFNASEAAAIVNSGSGSVITADERAKLNGIEAGAEINVNPDWNAISGDAQILNKPAFSEVASSGDYYDLINLPAIFDGTWTSLSGKPTFSSVAINGNYNELVNLPSLFDGTWTNLTGKPAFHAIATTGNYSDLTNKPILSTVANTGNYSDLTNKPTLSTVAGSGNYNDLTNKPTLFDGTWLSLSGKPNFHTVATSGNYNDLTNKPTTITTAQADAIVANTAKRSYPLVDETKLAGIQSGAEVNVNPDWNSIAGDSQILNKPTLSTVATSGSYNDLSNKPTLFSGSFNDLSGKPTTIAGYGITNAMSTSHAANGITATNISNWSTAYSWGNHAGLYRSSTWVPAWSDVSGKPTFSTVATSGNYNDLSNKPTFSAVATSGNYSDLAGAPVLSTVAVSGNYSDITGAPNLSSFATKNMNSENITNLANPVNEQDAATKSYSDMKFQMLLNYMVESGADIQGLLDAGISPEELVEAEASIADLLAGGASVSELFAMGVCVGTLRKAGALEADLIAAGLVGTLTDFEGNIYGWVKIGDQIWMDENLKSTKYADGTDININLPYTWGYYIYNSDPANLTKYGYIYNFEAALRGEVSTDANPSTMQGACPAGWHMPSHSEWTELKDYLINDGFGIDETNIGKAFASTTDWQASAVAGTVGNDQASNNDSGFDALPSGSRNAYYGSFGGMQVWTYFYSSTWNHTGYPYYDNYVQTPSLVNDNANMDIVNLRLTGYPIRCVKN
jgi:uncharacterized protein (TIGR02145 family)